MQNVSSSLSMLELNPTPPTPVCSLERHKLNTAPKGRICYITKSYFITTIPK